MLSFLKNLFAGADARQEMRSLYVQIIGKGREVDWYEQGQVPDNLDGRFDILAGILSLVLLRIEQEKGYEQQSVWLTEIFVDDMDAQLRQIGIGDVIVGKHIGKMVSALGGRLGAYRNGLAKDGDLKDAIIRNIFRGEAPAEEAVAHVDQKLRLLHETLSTIPIETLIAGEATL